MASSLTVWQQRGPLKIQTEDPEWVTDEYHSDMPGPQESKELVQEPEFHLSDSLECTLSSAWVTPEDQRGHGKCTQSLVPGTHYPTGDKVFPLLSL